MYDVTIDFLPFHSHYWIWLNQKRVSYPRELSIYIVIQIPISSAKNKTYHFNYQYGVLDPALSWRKEK